MELFTNHNNRFNDFKWFNCEYNYEYYDKNSSPEFEVARQLMNDWFKEYPTNQQERFKNDFLKDRMGTRLPELFIHNLLSLKGKASGAVYPEYKVTLLNDEIGYIDFFVQYEDRDSPFYVEVTTAQAGFDYESIKKLLSIIDEEDFNGYNFMFHVFSIPYYAKDVDYNDIIRELKRHIYALKHYGINTSTNSFYYRSERIYIRFSFIGQNKGSNSCVGCNPSLNMGNVIKNIEDRIQSKIDKYNHLRHPLVIVVFPVNAAHYTVKEVQDLLYGKVSSVCVYHPKAYDDVFRQHFLFNYKELSKKGLFYKYKNSNLHCVQIINNLYPTDITKLEVESFINPYSKHSI